MAPRPWSGQASLVLLAGEPGIGKATLSQQFAAYAARQGDDVALAARPTGFADDDRYRLLSAVTAFLCAASMAQPPLIVVEDLHDADGGTLDLLTHLARNLLFVQEIARHLVEAGLLVPQLVAWSRSGAAPLVARGSVSG
jgi:predicted ATPase